MPDTFTTDVFLRDFDHEMARVFDGIRQDSGDPITFAKKFIKHYEKLDIDPTTKKYLFSDGLNPEKCLKISNKLSIIPLSKKVFCLGTNLTNDVPGSPALNMVIKLTKVNGNNVVKLSDIPGKETGDPQTIMEVKHKLNLLENEVLV